MLVAESYSGNFWFGCGGGELNPLFQIMRVIFSYKTSIVHLQDGGKGSFHPRNPDGWSMGVMVKHLFGLLKVAEIIGERSPISTLHSLEIPVRAGIVSAILSGELV